MQMFFNDVISTLYCATGNIGNYVCNISLIQMTGAWMHSFFFAKSSCPACLVYYQCPHGNIFSASLSSIEHHCRHQSSTMSHEPSQSSITNQIQNHHHRHHRHHHHISHLHGLASLPLIQLFSKARNHIESGLESKPNLRWGTM